MSFEKSIDQLVYRSDHVHMCTSSRVSELWSIKQGEELHREIVKHETVPLENWATWLTDADAIPAASLKLLVISIEPLERSTADAKLHVEEAERLKRLFETVDLPPAGLGAYLQNLAQYSCVPVATAAGLGACSFLFSDPAICWTWSYCPRTKSTRAILLYRDVVTNCRSEECRLILERHAEFVDQPLLLAYVCIEAMGSRACTLISKVLPEVLQIERLTGLETWNPASESVLKKLDNATGEEDSLKVILHSQRVTDLRFRLTALLDYIPIVKRENRRHADFLRNQTETGYPNLGGSLDRTRRLDEVFTYFHDYLRVRLLKTESLANRLAAQVVAVEKLQALKQSQESKRIAEDSHFLAKESTKDSKSMMTISVVTMVFLPGTFIAALFAMPIFQWDASETKKVVNSRIWIYWAVTVPLTLAVLGTWTLYRHLRQRKESAAAAFSRIVSAA